MLGFLCHHNLQVIKRSDIIALSFAELTDNLRGEGTAEFTVLWIRLLQCEKNPLKRRRFSLKKLARTSKCSVYLSGSV